MSDRELPQLMLTREEAGKILRLGKTTIDKILKDGDLASVMVSGSRRVRMADMVAYINDLVPDLCERPPTHRLAVVSGQVLVVEATDRPAPEPAGVAA